MKIAIDASRAVIEKAGIGRHTRELVKKMIEIDQKNDYLLLFSFARKDLEKEKIIQTFKKENVEIKTWRLPGALKEKVWGWKVPWYGRFLKNADVFWAPSFFEANLGLKIPQVVTIYDLSTFVYPNHRTEAVSKRLNLRTKEVCQKAKKIIAISKSTANDLENILKISKSKIEVIYPGKNILTDQPALRLPSGIEPKKYILAVGTIEPRKNLTGLFKAYSLLSPALQKEYPLVVAGGKGWNEGEIYNSLRHLKLEDKIKFLGYVPDKMLAKLYKEAAVFCYPSFYEGFGFPVLEAMSYGTPVVTSAVSSLPEVCGDAALLCDPNEAKSIASAIERLLEHKEERVLLSKKGLEQAKKFSWEKAAKETIKVLEEVVSD